MPLGSSVADPDPNPDPDPHVFGPLLWIWIRIRILLSSSKYSKENLDFYRFVTFLDFLSLNLKNDVKVSSKSNMQENL
jgi:hypothetical protein